ncbi:hypothetical protein GOP47_0029974 [Adiantum capillus-veneris]|nr:hypothetical protein GOP47_0029974 [Adiantum capillus-veneris]
MASSDPINVKSLDIPQTADHVSFCDWMRVEVLWNTIEREARFLYNNMRNITSKLGPGEMLDSFLEEAKLTHRTEAFQYELGKFKSSGRGSPNLKKALTDAGQRCLCRWLTRRNFNIRSSRTLSDVLDISKKDTIFNSAQLARNFNKTVYYSCPWFLEYKEGKFPASEELQHNNAVKEREERARRAVRVETPETPTKTTTTTKTASSSDKVGQVSYSRTGTPKDIEKKPSSSELKKRKHDAVGPNEKEL